jgi:hypothetical protein
VKDDGFGHAFQNAVGDDRFVFKDDAQGDHQGDHHGQARMDGAGHEVGGEDGGVPAGYDAQGKIPGDHAVHRDDQRGGQGGEKEVAAGIVAPDLELTGPAQGEYGENFRLTPLARSRMVARSGSMPVYQNRLLTVR